MTGGRLTARAASYFQDAQRLERMPEFEAGGMTGPQWGIVYRAVAEELQKIAETSPPRWATNLAESGSDDDLDLG